MRPPAPDTLHSFESTYRAHFPIVWRTLRALGVVDSAVDDAAQDVFVVVHRRLGGFEGRASIKTWLYEITRRVALRYRHRAATDALRTFELPDLRAGDDLDEAVDRALAAEILQAFIVALDEDRRRAFVLAELWDMSGREIAEALDANMNTIYARIRSARAELDRITGRLRAKNARALTRAMRATVPSRESTERAWCVLLAKVGIAGAGAAARTSVVPGLLHGALVPWAATVAVGGILLLAGMGAAKDDDPARPEVGPENVEPRDRTRPAAASPGVPPTTTSPARERPVRPAPPENPRGQVLARRTTRPQPSDRALAEEIEVVRELRRAVATVDVTAARVSLDRYRRELAGGSLEIEVDALAVELACRRLAPDASSRLQAFRERWPRSGLGNRLETLCTPRIAPQTSGRARTHEP